jgi:hypothetical protein
MKRTFILFSAGLGIAALTFSSYGSGPANGGLGNRTGSDGATLGCSTSGCHNPDNTSLSITLSAVDIATSTPVTDGKYKPGHEYTIKIDAAYSGSGTYNWFGFQASIVNAAKADIGTITATAADTRTRPAGVTVIEHSTPLAAASGYHTSFKWTAPASGSGAAKLFVRVLAANKNGTPADDFPNAANMTLSENTTSIDDLSAQIISNLYPNPASTQLNISLDNAPQGAYSFKVFDLTGKCVAATSETVNGNTAKVSMDINQLAAGNYLVQISNNANAARVLPFIKK